VIELTPPVVMPADEALSLLTTGEVTIEGRITTASNATLYCRLSDDAMAAACVYKPIAGESPLWDFPDGTLAEREVAAYLVGIASGWNLVPPTVLRDGPLGRGMTQLWIDHDDSFNMIETINSGNSRALQRIALFDAVINNSDRKASHLLPAVGEWSGIHIYGIDHGVSFATADKLRTVLWQWAGEAIPDDELAVLNRLSEELAGSLGAALSELLTTAEVRATDDRISALLASGLFPMPPTDWPAVPWPPY